MRGTGQWDRSGRRRGTVLIVTIWVLLVLAGLVLVFGSTARVDAQVAANRASAVQAGLISRAALAYVLEAVQQAEGDASAVLTLPCEAVPVGGGWFWVLRTDADDDRSLAWGLVDEAGKVNLNAAPVEVLRGLPGMTESLAAAIVDWRDEDGEVTPGGAETETYLLKAEPYDCKNAPLETVQEVFLVEGALREIVLGEDANRNGVLDPWENDASEHDPPDNRDGRLDPGFLPWVTVYSREPNTSADGQERVNVNSFSSGELTELIRAQVQDDRFFQVMDRFRASWPFVNVLDFYFRSGLTIDEFRAMADRLTADSRPVLEGRINPATAPRAVLASLPGLDEADVDALIAARSTEGVDLGNIAWVAEALSNEKAVALGGWIGQRSWQYSADIVAVSGDGRAFRRTQVVVDAMDGTPRVVHVRDLTQLGWPLQEGVLESLRAGRGLPESAAAVTTPSGGGRP